MDKKMRDTLNEIYIEGMKLTKALVYYDTYKISELSQYEIPEKFKNIDYMTYFCSSIGDDVDKKIEEYQQNGEILKASFLDAWGSESVEEINEQFDQKLRENYGEGTMRFSPGYGEITIFENIKILHLLGVDENRITTHPKSGVLIPQKSTVCMIGWHSGNQVEE
jgi:hypothetical protein